MFKKYSSTNFIFFNEFHKLNNLVFIRKFHKSRNLFSDNEELLTDVSEEEIIEDSEEESEGMIEERNIWNKHPLKKIEAQVFDEWLELNTKTDEMDDNLQDVFKHLADKNLLDEETIQSIFDRDNECKVNSLALVTKSRLANEDESTSMKEVETSKCEADTGLIEQKILKHKAIIDKMIEKVDSSERYDEEDVSMLKKSLEDNQEVSGEYVSWANRRQTVRDMLISYFTSESNQPDLSNESINNESQDENISNDSEDENASSYLNDNLKRSRGEYNENILPDPKRIKLSHEYSNDKLVHDKKSSLIDDYADVSTEQPSYMDPED